VPAGLGLAAGPGEHGIDMSLRPRNRARRPHWLLAFTALFSRNGSPTDAPSRTRSALGPHFGGTRTLQLRGRIGREARSATRVGGVGVNVPPFRAQGAIPACGATGKTIETASWSQTELPV
jgi:hypothetical protein